MAKDKESDTQIKYRNPLAHAHRGLMIWVWEALQSNTLYVHIENDPTRKMIDPDFGLSHSVRRY